MPEDTEFGALLRRHRRRAGLSQEELAARAFVSTRTISDLERSVNQRPRRHTAVALADGLGLDGEEREAFERHARPVEDTPEVVPAAIAPCARAPLTVDTFVDDGSSIEEVLALVRDRRNRVVTLLGPGGVGKTRLALEMARRLDDPVGYVALASLTDPALLTATIVDVLGVDHGPMRTHLQSLVEHLAPRTSTLVLDNVEQLVDAAGDLAALVQSCPELTVVTTSRVPLRIAGEVRHHVRPLAPGGDDPGDWPAVRLFLERAGHAAVRDPSPSELEAIAELCARLDGLPLAIELAAARAVVVSPAEMLRHLDQVLDLLSSARADAPAHHRSMRAALEWSYRLLSPSAQDAFAALGVFASDAAPEAAMAVWGFPPASTPAFFDLLQALAEAHLVDVDPVGAGTANRITMFETTRQFAVQKLAGSDGAALASQRLAQWALDLVEQAEDGLVGPDQLRWLAVLDAELPNLRAVAHRLAGGDSADTVDAGLRLGGSLQRFFEIRCGWDEGVAWLGAALARQGGRPASRAKAHKALGVMYRCLGDLQRAAPEHDRAIELYASVGDDVGVARCLNNQALIALDQADFDVAAALHRRALEICEACGDSRLRALVLSNLSLSTRESGALRESLRLARESHRLLTELGNISILSWVEDNIASILTMAGRPSVAVVIHHRSARRQLEIGDGSGFSWSLEALAPAWIELGQTELAGRALGYVAALRRRLGTFPVSYLTRLTAQRTAALTSVIGAARFEELWEEGRRLDPELVLGWFVD